MNTPAPTSRPFPALLAQLHSLKVTYWHHEMDFEPYSEFLSAEETTDWMVAWTDQDDASGDELAVFGQDGSGGYTAFWLVNPSAQILEQPVIFLGSEGEMCVAAKNFGDYLWLLASGLTAGIGGCEPDSLEDSAVENPVFGPFAEKYATTPKRKPSEIVKDAHETYPGFKSWVNAMCKFEDED